MYKLSESPRGFAATSISDKYSSMAGLKSYSDGACRMMPAVPTGNKINNNIMMCHCKLFLFKNCHSTITFSHVELKGLG